MANWLWIPLFVLLTQPQISSGIKFGTQSVAITNSNGVLVATIPIQGIIFKKSASKLRTIEKAILFTARDACDLELLTHPILQMNAQQWDVDETVQPVLIVGTGNCDLRTKLENAHLTGYSAVIIHNKATNENPSAVVLEASDIISKTRSTKVYFVGQKHGRMLQDLFTFPKRYNVSVTDDSEAFYLTSDGRELNGDKVITHKVPEHTFQPKYIQSSPPPPGMFKVRTQDELATLLQENYSCPRLLAFFGGMFLWLLQNVVIMGAVVTCGCVGVTVLLSIFAGFARITELQEPPPAPQPVEPQNRLPEDVLQRIVEMLEEMRRGAVQDDPPLPEERIRTLLSYQITEEEALATGECSICIEILADGDQVTKLEPACTHVFHSLCIEHWLRIRSNCPHCRRPVRGNMNAAAAHID